MSDHKVLSLFPPSQQSISLAQLYLSQQLHRLGDAANPFIYANFVTSLDGRIALPNQSGHFATPKQLTTASDWCLFQQLHAQADCIITHGAYLRALAAGRQGNILQLDSHYAAWRQQQGLPAQPTIIIVSRSLDFVIPDSVQSNQQTVLIAATAASDPQAIAHWQQQAYEVVIAGQQQVEARLLLPFIKQLGCRSIYLLAGPMVLETMLYDGLLARLYLTLNHSFVGGTDFYTPISGRVLGEAGQLTLHSLYFQPENPAANGQFFACFEPKNQRQ